MADLTSILLQYGAPILKDIIEKKIGGIGGKMAGGVIDSLAKDLGTEPTEEAIAKKIEENPITSVPIIQRSEDEMTRIVESTNSALISYHGVLQADAQSEGILSRLWRPLFAIVFTLLFGLVGVTMCWLMWTRQLGTLQQLGEITTFLTFFFVAGCAVLGVQVFQASKTDREK